MDWNAKIFSYCERGLDPGFWAEPLNAISNAAFLIAAAAALVLWAKVGTERRATTELLLVLLVAVIGIGSFLFHTYATRWAVLADVLPITVFMIIYLGYALRRFAGAPWLLVAVLLAAFVFSLRAAESLTCVGRACLNGSVGYLPALVALIAVGVWLAWRGHPAAGTLLAGAVLFAVSLTLRTIDRSYCPLTAFFSRRTIGTHFLWHIANATLLFMLLRGALKFGAPAKR
ncbi:MAG: ceramidase domain-containing protein [Hyphomicrobiaceae bacterium]